MPQLTSVVWISYAPTCCRYGTRANGKVVEPPTPIRIQKWDRLQNDGLIFTLVTKTSRPASLQNGT